MTPRSILPIAGLLATSVALAGVAQAKPSIAVLGLEVKDDSGAMDEATTDLAKGLTAGLRQRATMPKSPYKLAPNSDKDLLELKLLSDCGGEGKACMADIGKELKADRLMYGRINKRKNGYQISLDLLNVRTKAMERSTSEIIPFRDSDTKGTKRWARKLYNRLTGIPELGDLVIKANVDKGTVYVDGEVKTTLQAGSARITGLSDGSHTVGIESEGYVTYAGEVTVGAGETSELPVNMKSKGIGGGGGPIDGRGARPGGTSRILFWTTLVATGAGAAAVTITGLQVRGSLKDDQLAAVQALADRQMNPIELDSKNACTAASGLNPNDADVKAVIDACDTGKSRASLNNLLIGGTVLSAVAASYFYYKGFIAPQAATKRETARSRRSQKSRRPTVRVMPAIGPRQVGAGVTIEF